MLEAIIAFFPVKEDHDAIGAIDYPIEVRKKYAAMSRKYKCDSCGSIATAFPEKKEKPQEVVNEPEKDGGSEKEDNISNLSGKVSQKEDTSPEIRPLNKKSKKKGIDVDRKSHVSHNIEGIIFEDVNEEDDNEEESRQSHRQTEPFKKEPSKQIEELKRAKSDVSSGGFDFSEYLRKIRQDQFGGEVDEEKPKVEEVRPSKLEDSVKVITKPREEKAKYDKVNMFLKSINEDIEFYELQKGIKIHQSLIQDDIVKDLLNDKINTFLNSESIKYLQELNLLSSKDSVDASEDKKEQLKDMLENFGNSQKSKFEDLLKQKNIALKYFAKKTYREANAKRIRAVSGIMIALIVCIFGLYFYFRSYF
jgi:hypothetical protein